MHDASKKAVSTSAAPAAIGPYSQAISCAGWLFCSGQIPLDPATGAMVEGGVPEQTRRVLENLRAVLAVAGLTLADVVKTSVFMTDLTRFSEMNAAYEAFFDTAPPPARAAVEVKALPKGSLVEIEAIARHK